MRTFWRIILGLLVSLVLSLAVVKLPAWVAANAVAFWIAVPVITVALLLVEFWPTREARLKRRTQKLLASGGRGEFTRTQRLSYWGTAPASIALIGRGDDEGLLKSLIASEKRAIGVFGGPGTGKSSLVANVARDVAALFDSVLWYSLQTAPPLIELIDRWLAALSVTPLTESLGERLDLLVALLARSRCLVVLDNAETVFDEARAVPRTVDPGYRELLQRLITNAGHSTLIITSTVTLDPFRVQPHIPNVALVDLAGLGVEAARTLLVGGGVRATTQQAKLINTAYSGNPQAILILAEYVRASYDGYLDRFLATEKDLVNFGRFSSLLERNLDALTSEERLLVFFLATWHEPVAIETLHRVLRDHLGFPSPVSVGELVASLRSRHLVVDTAEGISTSGFVLELTTSFLVRTIAQEIIAGKADLIAKCPLDQASWPDRVREHQKRFLLTPLVDRIGKTQGPRLDGVQRLLRSRIRSLGGNASDRPTYAVANMLQLLELAGDELTDLDLASLTIRGADFRSSWLRNTNFTGADLSDSIFSDCFGTVHGVALSADEALLAAGTSSGTVLVWSRDSGELLHVRHNHSEIVRSVCFSQKGHIVYSAGEDRRLVSWRFADDRIHVVENGHGNWIWHVASFDGWKGIATVGGDGRLRLWHGEPLKELATLIVASDWIWSFAYSQGRLVCVCEDGAVWSWQVRLNGDALTVDDTCRLEARLAHPVKAIAAAREEPELFYLGCGDGSLHRLNTASRELVALEVRHRGAVRSIARLKEPNQYASAGDDRVIRLWSGDGTAARLLEGHSSRIWCLASNDQTPIIASAGDDRSVRLWRTDGPSHPERSLHGIEYSVRSIDVDSAGRVVAASCDDVIRRWSESADTPEHVIVRRRYRLTGARAIGQSYVGAADDGTLILRTSSVPRVWKAHDGAVECLAAHDGRGLLASGGEDRLARIWHVTGGQLHELAYHHNRVWALDFSPNGEWLTSGGGDHVVGLWSTESGELHAALRGHRGLVLAVAWLDDNVFVSGGSDGTLCFWQRTAVAEGVASPVKSIDLGFTIRAIRCSKANGGIIVVGGRTSDPEGASKLVRLNGSGDLQHTLTGTLGGAIRAIAVDDARARVFVGGDGTDIVEIDALGDMAERRRLRIDGPYSGATFSGAVGLTEGERKSVQELGAVV